MSLGNPRACHPLAPQAQVLICLLEATTVVRGNTTASLMIGKNSFNSCFTSARWGSKNELKSRVARGNEWQALSAVTDPMDFWRRHGTGSCEAAPGKKPSVRCATTASLIPSQKMPTTSLPHSELNNRKPWVILKIQLRKLWISVVWWCWHPEMPLPSLWRKSHSMKQ